nr:hypothetical protein [Achromobacter sp. RTa]
MDLTRRLGLRNALRSGLDGLPFMRGLRPGAGVPGALRAPGLQGFQIVRGRLPGLEQYHPRARLTQDVIVWSVEFGRHEGLVHCSKISAINRPDD